MCPTLTLGSFFYSRKVHFFVHSFILTKTYRKHQNLIQNYKIGPLRDFFRKVFDCTKGSPFKLFDILDHNRCLKIPKGPPFQIFRHYETVQNCHFSSDIRFSQHISTNIFFYTIRNLNVISGVKRYIRFFDVISEVYSVLLRRRRRFENKCSHLSQRYIRTSEAFSPHGRLLWVNLFCEFFIKNVMSIF